ncbi:MAG: 4-oxalocrotonate tautomerase family protein [Pseudomonadota bacterium]
MPIVRITLAEGRSKAQKQALAREVTDSVVRHCEIGAEHVYVLFDDIPPDEWLVGGDTITERKRARGES